MYKKILCKLGIIFGIMLITVLIILGYRLITGTSIHHYQQYFFPCQGRMIFYEPFEKVTVPFTVLDEKEISEMYDKDNIKEILLFDEHGDKIKASNWEVSIDDGFSGLNEYSAKQLDVCFSVKKTLVFQKLEIVYIDNKSEVFDIGSLKIEFLEMNPYESSTQILPFYIAGKDKCQFYVENDFEDRLMSGLYFTADAFDQNYQITKIDMGIPGVGIRPDTLRICEEHMDFGENFLNNQEYKSYWYVTDCEELPESTVLCTITDTERSCAMVGFTKDSTFSAELHAIYYSPLFTCVNLKTGEEYLYGNTNNYYVSTSHTINDHKAKSLLEEYGR